MEKQKVEPKRLQEKPKTETKETQEKPAEKVENDEFDKIVKEFQKSNSVCSFGGCKKSTKLIKLICEFCKKWYCFEHGKTINIMCLTTFYFVHN